MNSHDNGNKNYPFDSIFKGTGAERTISSFSLAANSFSQFLGFLIKLKYKHNKKKMKWRMAR
ncbi:MAG: hypothetical protein ABIJ19_01160 [Patescibacteria group bacterium]